MKARHRSPLSVGILAACVQVATGALIGCDSAISAEVDFEPVLAAQESGVSVRLQAISAVDEDVVWVSGLGGTYGRTTDGGNTWRTAVVPGADALEFRDVDAFDENTAYLMSAGPGDRSRIYKTYDAGETWVLQYVNDEPRGFFDCMSFWDSENGIAFSDAVNSEFILIRTADGSTWQRIPEENVPDASPGEGSFAASGTCLVTYGDSTVWFGTGASETARIFKSVDRGETWSHTATPIVSDSMSGITSIEFVDGVRGLAVGGNIAQPFEHHDNVALTNDGGSTWTRGARPTFPGAVYGISLVPGTSPPLFVAVGPGGADYTADMGVTWVSLDTLSYWSVDIASRSAGWAVGPAGRIKKITF